MAKRRMSTFRIVQCVVSLKRGFVSNAEGARKADSIPMRDEPEKAKLLMNANQHDEPGTAQPERDGGAAFEQREGDMGNRRHRVEVRVDRRRAEGTKLPETGPAGAWRGAAVSGEGDGDQPRAIDPAD